MQQTVKAAKEQKLTKGVKGKTRSAKPSKSKGKNKK